jgi:hypothetical protein
MQNILVCHDGHKITSKGLLGFLKTIPKDSNVVLFHVLEPIPPSLAEHGGTEEEASEHREKRREWITNQTSIAKKALNPCMESIRALPHIQSSTLMIIPAYSVGDFEPLLEEEVRDGEYDEVLIIHHSDSWIKNILHETWSDKAKRHIAGVRLRIIRCSEKEGFCEI